MAEKKGTPVKAEGGSYLLKLDYNNLTAQAVGPENGLSGEDLEDLKKPLLAARKYFDSQRKNGAFPFADLPYDTELVKKCKALALEAKKTVQTTVVLGIGGSALGAKAIYRALKSPEKLSPSTSKSSASKLLVADNIDPDGFNELLDQLDLSKTFINVISKSGTTAETMSQFMVVYDRLQRSLGRSWVKEHILITTDAKTGVLRKIVDQDGLNSLEVPSGVGGRYSVLSAVGLAPLAMVGVDIVKLLAGAREAQQDFDRKPLSANKALLFAGLNYLMTTIKGRSVLVMMPYSDALAETADWFGQLWNESLGKAAKINGSQNLTGQTAVKALGVTDQHSQLQTYMEGPNDKTVCFLALEKFRSKTPIPKIFKEFPELSYLGGAELGQLLKFELMGTARALAENSRPNFTLTIPAAEASALGYLIQTLMLSTVISGKLYDIDPLDQPGVELGKKFTYGLMGRQGFEDFKERYRQGLAENPKFRVK
ncbi:MAG: glucose-6-phosphate isomerase [Deltaproteobacteria bacterium]|jgi:glucose-6-phosphate isomerase|nr:glucose-6-phosphate isomerase [Deltaproteobacteria bacterium]